MQIIRMVKRGKEIVFRVFANCDFQILEGKRESEKMPDFGAKYIALREAGFVEVK